MRKLRGMKDLFARRHFDRDFIVLDLRGYLRLIAVQQLGQHMHVRDRGRRRAEYTIPSLLSTPMCAFIPKNHYLPFFV